MLSKKVFSFVLMINQLLTTISFSFLAIFSSAQCCDDNGLSYRENLLIGEVLDYFPELDSINIRFKKSRIKTSLNARPTALSLIFRKRENRKYVVRINNRDSSEAILLSEAPSDARFGVLAHELCHIVDYNSRSFFGVIKRLLDYRSKKTKEQFEKKIDSMVIARGLGDKLYAWSYFVIHESNADQEYIEFKKQIYLEPEEIRLIMQP